MLSVIRDKNSLSAFLFLLSVELWQKLRSEVRIGFHICIRSLTKRLTSEEGRQLEPVTHTRILCSSQWSQVFSLMSFLQALLSLIAPPGPYYPADSKATCCTSSSASAPRSHEQQSSQKSLSSFYFALFFAINWSTFFHDRIFFSFPFFFGHFWDVD